MKKEIQVPADLSEVSLSAYQKLLSITEQNEEASDFIEQKTVQYLCDIPFEIVQKIKKKSFDEILNHLTEILQQEQTFTPIFNHKGKEWGFISNLDEITAGEFADLDNYFTEWDSMHKAMAVLYRPIIKKYKGQYLIEEYQGSNKYAGELKDMPLSVVLGARVFFWNLGIELSSHILKSLRQESQVTTRLLQTLEQNGVGISPFMESLEATISKLKQRKKSRF